MTSFAGNEMFIVKNGAIHMYIGIRIHKAYWNFLLIILSTIYRIAIRDAVNSDNPKM
jgi:hypothetical protein